MKIDLFQSWKRRVEKQNGHCWVFQIGWHIEGNTLTASSFRFWNSSAGIPSPLLALLIVMLPKAHLTSHSRMSGSTWVITPSWLSESWWSFFIVPLCSVVTSLYYLLLLLGPYHFCPLPALLLMKCSLAIFNFLEDISSLSHSIVFIYFFANSAFKWIYLSFSPLPFSSLLFSATCKASSGNRFTFLHFFFLWVVLITASVLVLQVLCHQI